MQNLESEYQVSLQAKDDKVATIKQKLADVKDQVHKEKEKWQFKLDALNAELEKANDRVYQEKARRRAQVQNQLDETARVEMILQNYVESLQEENEELRNELKEAIKDKRVAERKSEKDRRNAKARLEKWHAEQFLRRQAEDYPAEQEKINDALQKTLKKYTDVPQDTKRLLKKEWADEAAAHKRGGARRWPIWMVQLICELLVNGTSPAAIPSNIQTMYETLYGETPDQIPSVNFVRGCRVVVQVIGETVTAIKLGNAETWKQLWTDATTRRQIPFTALIIGILGDENDIDPVVVSSCIFMEDEQAETQADGILEKVCVSCLCIIFIIQ
jgi:hypothetical protein